MALYRPDYKLEKAKKLIDSLDKSEENDLIKYYIYKKEKRIEELIERLNEYSDFFRTLDRLLPNKNIRIK